MPGKANCCCPARMQHSVLLLAFAARTGVRTCRCALPTVGVGGEADAAVRADVVFQSGGPTTVSPSEAKSDPAEGVVDAEGAAAPFGCRRPSLQDQVVL
jgi:hypothetical protein